jgi:hypothetical protein
VGHNIPSLRPVRGALAITALAAIVAATVPASGLAASFSSKPTAAGGQQGRPYPQHRPDLGAGSLPASRASSGPTATSLAATVGGHWTSVGPQPIADARYVTNTVNSNFNKVSGRITSLAVDPTNALVVYAGSAGGGVWKSANGGTTWTPLTDSQPSLVIGALAISPTNHNVIYAATGEDNNSGDSQVGVGILKSINAGATWSLLAPTTFGGHFIGSLAIDRSTTGATEHVFAATDRGLFESANAGGTWTQNTQMLSVISVPSGFTASGGTTQVVQDPTVATRFFAAVTDFCRSEFGQTLVSTNGGTTWASSDNFADDPNGISRIALGIGSGGVAYSAGADCNGNLAVLHKTASDVAGPWTSIPPSTPGIFNYFSSGGNGQGDYDTFIGVDPTNNNSVVYGGVTAVKTTNGGASFTEVGKPYSGGVVHPDFHAIAFTAANTFYVGNDGGVWKTVDLGGTGSAADWTDLNTTLDVTMFNGGVALDVNRFLGGAQDNGTSGHLPSGAPALPAFQAYEGGDGSYTAIDPTAGSTTIFAQFPHATVLRGSSTVTASPTSPYDSWQLAAPCRPGHTPTPDTACADPSGFSAPLVMDAANHNRLLVATNKVYQNVTGGIPAGMAGNAGGSWTAISPDLTTGKTLFSRGDFINALQLGPAGSSGVIITGSAGGRVELTVNGGTAWQNITGNLPAASGANFPFGPINWVNAVAVNPANHAEAWVAIGATSGAHIFHTVTAGGTNTWAALDGSGATALPNVSASALVVSPTHPGTVFVGTTHGAFVCTACGGASPAPSWANLGSGFPAVLVHSLSFSLDSNHLFAWTYGRGLWTLDLRIGSASTSGVAPATQTVAHTTGKATVTVVIRDASGSPISGKTVSLIRTSGPGTPVVQPASGVTNANGTVIFTITSSTVGTDVFQVRDVTDGVVLTPTATVTFT